MAGIFYGYVDGAAAGWFRDAARLIAASRPMRRLGRTPAFRGPDGNGVPGSIAEVAYRRLGGLDQWVLIRGRSVVNPPLILPHGGPGLSETSWFRSFNAPLEDSFTVVYWDQRGAGKSYDRRIPRSSMTVDRFVADLDDVVEAVRERTGAPRKVIFGHSWGSALGVLYAGRSPEKVAAYVGSGQYGDAAAGHAASHAYALGEAQRRGNRRALVQLRQIEPRLSTREALWSERAWVMRFDGGMRPIALWKIARASVGAPESSLLDLPRTVRGFRFSLDAMWAETSRLNLLDLVPAVQMPVFFLLGRYDHWVPPQSSVAYFEALAAPSKELVWFEQSGHEPVVDEPARFTAATAELVRPGVDSGPPVRAACA
jgi:pimeloyl-ACP methyl ester carboxylesterase